LKGGEFLRKLHGLARRKSVSYLFIPAKGKGSHGKVYFGTASTARRSSVADCCTRCARISASAWKISGRN